MLKALATANRGWKAHCHFLQNVLKRSSASRAHLSPDTYTAGVEWCGIGYQELIVMEEVVRWGNVMEDLLTNKIKLQISDRKIVKTGDLSFIMQAFYCDVVWGCICKRVKTGLGLYL